MIAANRRSSRLLVKPALFVLLLGQLLLLANNPIATQASSSSYLDDYFSTAKYALNKLQQSLTASSGSSQRQTDQFAADKSTAPPTTILPAAAAEAAVAAAAAEVDTTSTTTAAVTTSFPSEAGTRRTSENKPPAESEARASSEPDKSEFVKLDTAKESDSTDQSTGDASVGSPDPNQPKPEESSPAGASLAAQTDNRPDETATKAVEPATEVARAVDDGPSLVVEEPSNPAANGRADETNPNPNLSSNPSSDRSNSEEMIKETEMNAVAAVDLSMGFGNDLHLFQSEKEPCYDEYGNPRFCEPEFENVAFERQVEVSSECGQPASRFCTTSAAGASQTESQIRNCHICDAQHPKKRHPASYLTDLNSSQNPTCWVSAPIQVSPAGAHNESGSLEGQSSGASWMRADNVSLVVNLDKRYEILYVSMQFCSLKPDSLAIYKSNDFGQSWQAYQFYSSHCARLYGRQQQRSASSAGAGKSVQPHPVGSNEASCANVSSSGSSASRVAFSTLDGARVGLNLDKSPALQDWISATNIKITLDHHQAAWIQSTLALHSRHSGPDMAHKSSSSSSAPSSASAAASASAQTMAATSNATAAASEPIVAGAGQESSQQLTNPSSDTFNYAISDLTIGGRCKCNGHASRCIHGKDGRLQCDCRHNTAGRDCERCAPLHADRPWARATPTEANICQACNCNGHSRKCRFDPELYRLSGKRSGGVCLQCKDNTDGRYCHYCKEGFTRDHSKPMSDKEACKACDCHPIGSLGRVCNQTSGQCPCKEGVTGPLCNRCAAGYQQSSSQSEPCIRIPPETGGELNNELSATEAADDQPTIDQGSSESDTPVIAQDQLKAAASAQLQPQQQPQQQLLPAMTSRAPSGGDRWSQPDENGGRYWSAAPDQVQPDDDLAPIDNDRPPAYGRPASVSPYWQLATGVPARKHPTKQPNAYYTNGRLPSGLVRQSSARQPLDETGSLDDVDDSMEPLAVSNEAADSAYGATRYAPGYPSSRQRYPAHGRYQHYQQHYRQRPMQPVASLAPDEDDDTSPMNQYPYQASAYSDEFNQIDREAPAHRRYQLQQQRTSGSSQTRRPATLPSTSNSISSSAGAGAGVSSNNNNNNNVHSNVNSIVSNQCGDCQSNMRRLKSAKFCELEFAIRCSILNKFVAEDWTKLDVDIQDIFKSPMGATGHHIASRSSQSHQFDSQLALMQHDSPVALETAAVGSPAQTSVMVGSNKTTADNDIVPQHRLKVGTVQTIWVPTEDLACKCLRLKRGSTYLLMGTIDAKENSVNSLQLDRHGVAMEWRPSLQTKMLKLQRKYARGSLCV